MTSSAGSPSSSDGVAGRALDATQPRSASQRQLLVVERLEQEQLAQLVGGQAYVGRRRSVRLMAPPGSGARA